MNTILISGANSHIGSYLAHIYEAEGKKLLLLYHKHKQRISDLKSPQISVDLRDYNAVSRYLTNYLDNIDAMIHCAAVRSEDHQFLDETKPDIFYRVLEDNIYPAYNLLKLIIPSMRKRSFGRIILFSSDVSKTGLARGSAYAAAKAAIANIAKSCALENAEYNVLVNCIAPGPVETNTNKDFTADYQQFREQYFAKHLEQAASKALVKKDELKAVTDLLLSSNLRNLCGEEIVINGGKA